MVSSCSLSLALSLFGQRVCKEGGGLRGRRWGVSAAIGGVDLLRRGRVQKMIGGGGQT